MPEIVTKSQPSSRHHEESAALGVGPKKKGRWTSSVTNCQTIDETRDEISELSKPDEALICLGDLISKQILDPNAILVAAEGKCLSIEELLKKLSEDEKKLSPKERAAFMTLAKAASLTQLIDAKHERVGEFQAQLRAFERESVGQTDGQKKVFLDVFVKKLAQEDLITGQDQGNLNRLISNGEFSAVILALQGSFAQTLSTLSLKAVQQRNHAKSISLNALGNTSNYTGKNPGGLLTGFVFVMPQAGSGNDIGSLSVTAQSGISMVFENASFHITKEGANKLESALCEYAEVKKKMALKHEQEEAIQDEEEVKLEKEKVRQICLELGVPSDYVQLAFAHLEQLSTDALRTLIKSLQTAIEAKDK